MYRFPKSRAKANLLTDAEIKNDPSLRWFPYRRGELLWSDDLQQLVRFGSYSPENRHINLMNLELGDMRRMVHVLRVRRPTN